MKIESLPVKAYRVSDGENFADIVLNLGESSVTVMVHSSFGSFNNHWNQTGDSPLQFLRKMDYDYAMSKFKGELDVVLDADTLKVNLLSKVLAARRINKITQTEARVVYDALSKVLNNIDPSATADDVYCELVEEYTNFGHYLTTHVLDLYSVPVPMKYSESCRRFWNELWMPFLKNL